MPGFSVYSMFSTLRPDLIGKGAVMLFWLDFGHYLNSQGFRVMYGRLSNIKSYHLFSISGGDRPTKIKTEENGKSISLGFIRWPLNPFFYNNHIAEQYKKKAHL